jgi:sterol 3beta-glucosyltransferase
MRCLLLTVGSRGDAEPFVAIADELLKAGHEVDIFLQPEHEYNPPHTRGCSLSPHETVTIHRLPFTQQDFYRFVGNPLYGKGHSDARVQFSGIVSDIIAELVLPCMKQVLQVAQEKKTDMILCSSLARPLSISVSRHLHIPLGIIHLQPLVPTKAFPHFSRENAADCILQGCKEDPQHEMDYFTLEQYQHDFLAERLDQMSREVLGCPAPTMDDVRAILTGKSEMGLVFNCYSSDLCPAHAVQHDRVYNIGALADNHVASDFEPPADLEAFLKSHENDPPTAVGFGSMPFGNAQVVAQALESINRPAVLIGNALSSNYEETDWTRENLFSVSSVPYPWLLPQCCCMVSHGGAGVLHATLRAGIPAIIAPLMGDQFFWAKLVAAKGLGVNAGPMSPLTADGLVESIGQAADDCKVKAKEFGDKIKNKNAALELVCILETIVGSPKRD